MDSTSWKEWSFHIDEHFDAMENNEDCYYEGDFACLFDEDTVGKDDEYH